MNTIKYNNTLSLRSLVTAATAGIFFFPMATAQEKTPDSKILAEVQILEVEGAQNVGKPEVKGPGKVLVLGKDGKVVEAEPGGDLPASVKKVMLHLMKDKKTGDMKFEKIDGNLPVVLGKGDGAVFHLSKDKETGKLKLEKGKKGAIQVDSSGGVFKIGPAVILGEKSTKINTGSADVVAELDAIKKELAEQRRLLENIQKLLSK